MEESEAPESEAPESEAPEGEARPATPSIADLPLGDQLLHGIGRVAQAQVQVELTLRQLYTAQALPSTAVHLVATRNSIDQLAQDCRVMLKNSDLADDIKSAGDDALRSAIEADKRRHKVVHEWWVQEGMGANGPDAPQFQRLKASKKDIGYTVEPSGLDFVNEAEEALRRAVIRVSSLAFAVTNLLVGGVQLPGSPYDDELLPTIRGEFTLMPDGGWRVESSTS